MGHILNIGDDEYKMDFLKVNEQNKPFTQLH